MPEVGEIQKDQSGHIRSWQVCQDCGTGHWVRYGNGKLASVKCSTCSSREALIKTNKARTGISWDETRKINWRGEGNSQWKGGRRIQSDGYILLLIQPDDPFYAMADKRGVILEHRLVMAKRLGRLLSEEEVVHHKGTKYPMGSIEDKQDNRFENFGLFPSKFEHNKYHLERAKNGE